MIDIKIRTSAGANIPIYKSAGASGADISARIDEPIILQPGETALIPTGISIELPEGYEAQIRPRSGLAINHGITLLNTPGTIDSDYRGEIKVIMTNLGSNEFTISDGMRIAQMVFTRTLRGNFIVVNTLGETGRNEGGFGHSGV
ncbi:MAG: dUTP diphosphatase [Bacteroidales bacterium]|jgi:dUTP pyrophosphatase|nr:dUTP diphosphatase [Bacteroidales bacterium]